MQHVQQIMTAVMTQSAMQMMQEISMGTAVMPEATTLMKEVMQEVSMKTEVMQEATIRMKADGPEASTMKHWKTLQLQTRLLPKTQHRM